MGASRRANLSDARRVEITIGVLTTSDCQDRYSLAS
jgi:hypothetical protein